MTTENRSPQVSVVTWAMWAITVPAMFLRLWTRLKISRSFGIDDWFMVAAMVSFTVNTAVVSGAASHGVGRHSADLTPAEASLALHFWYYCYLTYCTTMILSKTSVAYFLLRLSPFPVHRAIIYVSLGCTVVCGIAFFFMAMFQCWPIHYFWNRIPGTGSCVLIDVIINFTYAYSAFSIITDFAFTILPIWLIWQLRMDLKTKLALIPILGMAAVASCAVAVRLAYVEDFRGNEFLWSISDIAFWSQTEEGLAITAGCLATLRPLFRKILEKLGLTKAGSSNDIPEDAVHLPFRTFGRSTRSTLKHRGLPNNIFNLSVFTCTDEEKTYSKEELKESAACQKSRYICEIS
ncbi:hypothetical protein TruAng_000720 [Truncatella angustata]|nr:hypothetical protein TruAng_000720 [Truncatella angustata]